MTASDDVSGVLAMPRSLSHGGQAISSGISLSCDWRDADVLPSVPEVDSGSGIDSGKSGSGKFTMDGSWSSSSWLEYDLFWMLHCDGTLYTS